MENQPTPVNVQTPQLIVNQTSQAAIWSLVLGILGMTCISCCGSIPAIILGHIAQSNIKQSGGALSGKGLALAGLILGYLNLLFFTIVMILMLTTTSLDQFKQKMKEDIQKRQSQQSGLSTQNNEP